MSEKKKKPGRVVRLNTKLQRLLEKERAGRETVSATLFRLIDGPQGTKGYVLPSDIHRTKAEARGEAIVRATKRKSRNAEAPLEIRVMT